MNEEINIFKCLDFLRDNSVAFAQAKADRTYMEEMRKSKKALCMKKAESAGHKSAAMQEREAYADPEYLELLKALQAAVEIEETLRWQMIAAQAKISVFQTLSANSRAEAKNI